MTKKYLRSSEGRRLQDGKLSPNLMGRPESYERPIVGTETNQSELEAGLTGLVVSHELRPLSDVYSRGWPQPYGYQFKMKAT